jgi:hypothetical protein
MKKSIRLSEQWFRRGLWLIAFLFAAFLIGLSSKIIGDLPHAERSFTLKEFLKPEVLAPLEAKRDALKAKQDVFDKQLTALERKHTSSTEAVARAEENLNSWLATRHASESSDQNPNLIKRTQELETLRGVEQIALQVVRDKRLENEPQLKALEQANAHITEQENLAQQALYAATKAQDLRVFLYRLAFTLPLLLLAGWLFAKQRKSQYWPFVWGFVFFALFAFFVELVPYMPSYGGYVRYAVGVVITVLIGRYAIKALQRYQAKQAEVELMPEEARREDIDYEQALQRMAKNICPGCERPINLANEQENYCGHCGMGLFRNCTGCATRNNAFIRFCKACGLTNTQLTAQPAVQPAVK